MAFERTTAVILGTVSAGLLAGCSRGSLIEETRFSPGFSEHEFRRIVRGMSTSEVVGLVGLPLETTTQSWLEVWSYWPPSSGVSAPASGGTRVFDLFGQFTRLSFTESGAVGASSGAYLAGDFTGLSKEQVRAKLGEPSERVQIPFAIVYRYTLPLKSGNYRLREVHFDAAGKVSLTLAEFYGD
jgi:hypothetical protein